MLRRDPPFRALPSRRAVVQGGAAFLGLGLSSAGAEPPGAPPDLAARPFDVRAFGTTGVRADSATRACQAAIDACARAGGGTVLVPPGAYTVGMLQLKDNVTLDVAAGATLFLSQNEAEFPRGRRAMIHAEGASNIGVTGRGTLDGLAQYVYTEMRGIDPEIEEEIATARAAGVDMRRYYRTGMQAYMVLLNGCRNVLLRDISIVGSPLWNVRLNDCDRVHVGGVAIHSDLERGVNADGIDIVSTSNVTISDCLIETADDAIVLKTIGRDGRAARPTENVTVTNCVLSSSSTPLMIGTETEADIRHVIFSHCVIRNSNKGFGINVQDGGTVSDIVVSHLTVETARRHWNWWGSAELCKLVLKRRTPESRLGAIRNVLVDGVTAEVRGTSTMTGHAERPIENVHISNVDLRMLPEEAVDTRATDALVVADVRDLRIRDLAVRWSDERTGPDWRSALVLRRVHDFVLDGFAGRQGLAGSDRPAIVLDDAIDGVIANARGTTGCRCLVHVQGDATRDVTVRDSRVPEGAVAIAFEDDRLRRTVLAW